MSNGQAVAAGGTAGYKTDKTPWKGSKALYTFDFEKGEHGSSPNKRICLMAAGTQA